MDADVVHPKGGGGWVILEALYINSVKLFNRNGERLETDMKNVTPRPDLPRMEWPGDTPHKGPKVTFAMPALAPAPALPDGWRLADHEDHGRVIVTNTTPNQDGRVYFVTPTGGTMGNACDFCRPDELTYIDQEAAQ